MADWPTCADHGYVVELRDGWSLIGSDPGSCQSPDAIDQVPGTWVAAQVPGTVAGSLDHDINSVGAYDSSDWWYQLTFGLPGHRGGGRQRLRFEGLATLCDVWLNGTAILSSRNMFLGHAIDVTALLQPSNRLVLRFRSLTTALAERRPRPRWKTALVENQNLRWFRTTLLGRIPGWTPPITPVGPWRPVRLECSDHGMIEAIDLRPSVEGADGKVWLRVDVIPVTGKVIQGARLRVGDYVADLGIVANASADRPDVVAISGELRIPNVPRWWPHTHGEPHQLPARLDLLIGGVWYAQGLGPIGFRELRVDQDGRGVRFLINGTPVFCRGACWTTADILTLDGDEGALRSTLELMRDAGLNMVRVGGTMVYESDAFYGLCDELGILVWQDFMFANMDYPVDDPEFRVQIERESEFQLNRMRRHVSIAAYCGGSEVAQQSAMLGRPAVDWSNDFFAQSLPDMCAEHHPGITYFPSSPWGGALPFHVGSGIAHYYGVGAYKRPISEVKHAGVKFTTECLGFSNVPDAETITLMLGGLTPPPHHPRWKARQPRDSGAGWDFEDIRDHYYAELFDASPIEDRSIHLEGYYARSRVVTGEVMKRVFSEWRRPENPCGGALVWFLKDLWPGAGWGIVDSTGRPKASYWYLRRAWGTRMVWLTDDGLDGLSVVVTNEAIESLSGDLELELFQDGRVSVGSARAAITVPAHGVVTLQADAMLGYFSDLNRAYRFGPPKHDTVVVRLSEAGGKGVISEDFYFPGSLDMPRQHHIAVDLSGEWQKDGVVRVTMKSPALLQSVSVTCRDFAPNDNYFHVAPGFVKELYFTPRVSGIEKFKVEFSALNVPEVFTLRVNPPLSVD